MLDVSPQILQFVGSLTAILILAGIAKALGLGRGVKLRHDDMVRDAASEIEDGFESQRISISRERTAALARDSAGRIMLIKRHGNKFAGRILTSRARVFEQVDTLHVESGETHFGTVQLTLDDPAYWADAINRL